MKLHNKEKNRELITESLNEFKRCPVGYQIYLRITIYSNDAILSQIRYNDEVISIINEENIVGANMLDYFEYNRDQGIPNLQQELSKIYDVYNQTA